MIGKSHKETVLITPEIVSEEIISKFEAIFYEVLRRQLDVHNELDAILKKGPEFVTVKKLKKLVSLNPDARQYFYLEADKHSEKWLDFLFKNKFLDSIKKKPETVTQCSYSTPELNYLLRIVDKMPKKVVEIMVSVPISEDKFNPEVIDTFLGICGFLPAHALVNMVVKIRDDGWVKLMHGFNYWGDEFKTMFKTLEDAEKYDELLVLAEAVLVVKTKQVYNRANDDYGGNRFYFVAENLSYINVFQHLISVDDKNTEKALAIACRTMAAIIELGDYEQDKTLVFKVKTIPFLNRIDFFDITLETKDSRSNWISIKNLAASISYLVQRLFENNRDNKDFLIKFYDTYFRNMPDCRSMWRLQLYVMSLCPGVFQDELKQSFSRLFTVIEAGQNYQVILLGTEYKKALKKSFAIFDSNYQQAFIRHVFRYFEAIAQATKEDKHKDSAWQILSSICGHLTEQEKEKCETMFGEKCDPNFTPLVPRITGSAHYVLEIGAVSQEAFGEREICDVVEKLKYAWTPERLATLNTTNDHSKRINARGVGNQIECDIPKRLQDYLKNAHLFFDRDALNAQYTSSFFTGLKYAIKANKNSKHIDLDALINTINTIRISHKKSLIDLSDGWRGVKVEINQLLKTLINEIGKKINFDFDKYRDKLFDIIKYYLTVSDPELENETIKIVNQADEVLTTAINSIRGCAFEAFVAFVCQEKKQFLKTDAIKIKDDVKAMYEVVLKNETTCALRFMIGHYIPTVYFCDKDWICRLLKNLPPADKDKQHLYFALWEGYLNTILYEEIFFDSEFQKLYKQYYTSGFEKVNVNHIALAFIAYNKRFGFNDDLFKTFWSKHAESQADFIRVIGKAFILDSKQYENKASVKDRLKYLWEWVLEENASPQTLRAFGSWITADENLFEPIWLAKKVKETLEKTQGLLNDPKYLIDTIYSLAKASPTDTFEIARLFLLKGFVRNKKINIAFAHYDDWEKAFRIFYDSNKSDTEALINSLNHEGGCNFWGFKHILKNSNSCD